jgi:hypothetical protein
MIALILSYALFVVSIFVVAFVRMLSANARFSYGTVVMHLCGQAVFASGLLWLTSLAGPVEAKTIALTSIMLMIEAVFRVMWRMRG